MDIKKFERTIWSFYKKNKRNLAWRKTKDPYKILVSEIMLQQTQVARVVVKYKSFLEKFPNVSALGRASVSDVLKEWQGLGYNRRALLLKKCSEIIEKDFKGKFPKNYKTLLSLPGIGPATAGDIMAFAWNIPVVVIETNIRSVFIHFFFQGREKIQDKEIIPLIERTLSQENPREWYWALFDYGAYLKATTNPGRRSAHHVKQSSFAGSHRQKRAEVVRLFLRGSSTKRNIQKKLGYEPGTISKILLDLQKEGFIRKMRSGLYTIL